MNIILLLLFVVMLVIGIVKEEYKGGAFWFQALVGSVIVVTYGGFAPSNQNLIVVGVALGVVVLVALLITRQQPKQPPQ